MTAKTSMAKPAARRWHLVDADGKVLGRLSTRIATILLGKHKANYVPHWDHGDHVVVINAAKVKVTGKKESDKTYYHYSGYPGGMRARTVADLRKAHPERLVQQAVKGMLPKTRLGRRMLTKLRVYPGAEHPHQAQNPEPIRL